MTYTKYRIELDFEAQNSPSDHESRQRTHSKSENFDNLEEALDFIQKHTEIENLAESGQATYIDREQEDGTTETVKTGKAYSYWTEYMDRNRGHYNVWETAWVTIKKLEIEELPIEEAVNEVEK